MRFVSLFSGIGGFDLGFKRAGLTCILQVEIDKHCRNVLARHWPGIERIGDVKEIKHLEAIDLICGGFPCQDISVAGRRAGLAGKRSGLWHEFHRILAVNLPRWVVVENVPGLLSSNEGWDFATLLRGLVECGYGVAWRILDAQYFGVAQRRRRVFIVGNLGSGRAAEVLFEREGRAGDSAPRRETGEGAPGISGTLSASAGGTSRPAGNANELDFCVPLGFDLSQITSKLNYSHPKPGDPQPPLNLAAQAMVAHALNAKGGSGQIDFESETFIANPLGAKWRGDLDNDTYVAGALHNGTPSRDASDAGNNHLIAFAWQQGTSAKGGREWVARAGDYAGGLSESRHDAVAGAFGVRRLTPLECERLQGFPGGWTNDPPQSDSVRYRQLGNAVCVPVAEWIGRRIVEVER